MLWWVGWTRVHGWASFLGGVAGWGSDTALQALPLRHAVEEVQVVKAKAFEIRAVLVADADFLIGQVEPGQQVVVQLLGVGGVQPDGDGDVWVNPLRIKPYSPALVAIGGGLAPCQYQADDQFIVEGEQISLRVSSNPAAQFGDGLLSAADYFRVQLT